MRLKTMPMSPQLTDAAAAAVAAVTAAAAALSGTKRHCCVGTRARESARAHSVQYYEGTMGECSADYGTGTAVQAREEHEDRQLPQVVRNAQPTKPDQPCHSTAAAAPRERCSTESIVALWLPAQRMPMPSRPHARFGIASASHAHFKWPICLGRRAPSSARGAAPKGTSPSTCTAARATSFAAAPARAEAHRFP